MECIPEIKPFIKKCLYIGWMMVVQTPPMCFHDVQCDSPFDTARFRHYSKSGTTVKYIVWPAMLLKRDGPLVCKGVAQGK